MKIGELASAVGLPTRTIRFYEKRHLLPEPQRQANGYRVYTQDSVDRVQFIRRAQAAGLTLAEISGVLEVRAEGGPPCEHVTTLLESKLDDVDRRITELCLLQGDLTRLIDRSRQLNPAQCDESSICHILIPLDRPSDRPLGKIGDT